MLQIVWAIIFLFFIAACAPAPAPVPATPTSTLTPSPVPTDTIVWFPPTATYTRLPNITAAPVSKPALNLRVGDLIFRDDFNQHRLWSVGKQNAGSIAYGADELSLGVSQPHGYLFSLREETMLDNFYLEITANPSICRKEDEYGVIFRITPTMDFYRFGLTCSGKARLDRYLAGVASSLQPPTPNGAIPPGAPSSSRLGIWVFEGEMLFLINGEHLFQISDNSIKTGGIGVYARACGPDFLTVNFSNLVVNHTQP